jgi:hypothetical protein
MKFRYRIQALREIYDTSPEIPYQAGACGIALQADAERKLSEIGFLTKFGDDDVLEGRRSAGSQARQGSIK